MSNQNATYPPNKGVDSAAAAAHWAAKCPVEWIGDDVELLVAAVAMINAAERFQRLIEARKNVD